jgi:putative addiction module CopG family antidote
VSSAYPTAVFQAPDKAVILSEALRSSIANRALYARSRRACPERSRRNPGDACWQMLLGAFRPQTTGEEEKSQTPTVANPDFLPHRTRNIHDCAFPRRKGLAGHPHCVPLTPAARPPTLNPMEVHLTPDQKAFVRQAIQSGRLNREEEAVQEALSLWEQRERARAEILTAVDMAEASVARGEGRAITQESMRQLADEVKQRGRNRLTAERSSPR